MTTLNGSISRLIVNANAMFDSFGYISSNVANLNTTGYKAERFETYLTTDGRLEGRLRTDYSKGDLMRTDRDLDVAVDGPGFFPLTDKNGSITYTRDGSFTVNADGYVVSSDGSLVGDGVKIPANYEKLKIQSDGTVNVLKSAGGKWEKIGKIPVVVFNNPEGLKKLEGNKVAESAQSGKATLLADNVSIKQSMLERANVDVYSYVNDSLKINGSLISSTRLLKALDELYRESINLRQ